MSITISLDPAFVSRLIVRSEYMWNSCASPVKHLLTAHFGPVSHKCRNELYVLVVQKYMARQNPY